MEGRQSVRNLCCASPTADPDPDNWDK